MNTRDHFYGRIDPFHMAPLWTRLKALVPPEPTPVGEPHRWRYAEVRPYVLESAEHITAKEAERRVLILENPGLRGKASTTHSLYAGVQLVLPGEVAPAHRHTQSAFRFVLEGQGGYTAVSGERTIMSPGDFVTTPAWTWHDHGNETEAPMVWLDVLDIPVVRFLDASFSESANADSQELRKPVGDSAARFAQNMFPVDWKPDSQASPIFNYPYERSRSVLRTLADNGEPDACHGYKLRYVNPASGEYPLPTMGGFIQLLPAGFTTAPYRSTDATIYVVVEGEGETRLGDVVMRWKPRDIFVVPSWAVHTHRAKGEAVLFSASDRPLQDKLSLWREERSE
jgi:gentisate 1,2-dioxygenase